MANPLGIEVVVHVVVVFGVVVEVVVGVDEVPGVRAAPVGSA
jgi:hypothetical protein